MSGNLCIYHPRLLEKLGCSLVYTEDQKGYFGQFSKAFTLKDPPQEVAHYIRSSSAIHVHPDGFEYWIEVLDVLTKQKPLSIQVFLVTGSDYTIRDDHIEQWTHTFPRAKFFIQNFCGSDPNCSILPIGSFNLMECQHESEKSEDLVISYFEPNNSEERRLLKAYIERTPELARYSKERQSSAEYSASLQKARFSVCPLGNGYDTMRFWESLAVGAIPIVLANEYTLHLKEQHPGLPFVLLSNWEHLVPWLQEGTIEQYSFLRSSYSDLSPGTLSYWTQRIEEVLSAST